MQKKKFENQYDKLPALLLEAFSIIRTKYDYYTDFYNIKCTDTNQYDQLTSDMIVGVNFISLSLFNLPQKKKIL